MRWDGHGTGTIMAASGKSKFDGVDGPTRHRREDCSATPPLPSTGSMVQDPVPRKAPLWSTMAALTEPGPRIACQNRRNHASGGRLLAHGMICSKAREAWSTRRSWKRPPTICRPTGRPSGVKPQGQDAAGSQVRLNG